jgi:hypothetical protein
LIIYNNQLIAKRVSKNISVGGILIITEDLGLPAYALVEIELNIPEDVTYGTLRIPGVVNRVNSGEIAIAFETLDKGAEIIIKKLLRSRAASGTELLRPVDRLS